MYRGDIIIILQLNMKLYITLSTEGGKNQFFSTVIKYKQRV